MTAAEVFDSVTNGGASDFDALVRILNKNKPWCLIGGLAVNCYVEPVYTIDADIVIVADRLRQICDEMERAGFEIQRFEHSINAKRGTSQLRVQFTTDARYQEFLTNTEEREVLGQQVPVATLENIVLGKLWAWKDQSRRASKRKKDELDLLRIAEAYPKLRKQIPAEIVEQLK
jgi:Nucleotidyl transferase AbiEii toxin, Type IV TA system